LPLDRSRPYLTRVAIDSMRSVYMPSLSAEALASLSQSEEHLALLRAIGPEMLLAVPLVVHGKALGAIALLSSTASRPLRDDDVRLLEELADRAALSIENARLFRAAQRAIQVRDEVAGVVAHDLRNPLNAIFLQVDLLRRGVGLGERRIEG